MKPVFLADGLRTPIGSFGGSLAHVRADDLAAHVIARLLERRPTLDAERIADVMLGCANQAGEDNRNVARMALLLAGLPASVPGETVNRLCASGMSAVANASRAIREGDGEVYIAGGVEQMTRAPYVLSKSSQAFARNAELFDTSLGWRFVNPRMRELYGVDSMGQTAENVATDVGISRADQDAFALWSQQKTAASRQRCRFQSEIVPVAVPGAARGEPARLFAQDEFPRPDSTLEVLGKLKPAFRTDGKGSVTAGNSSGLNDGAAALVIASAERAGELGATPLARYVAGGVAGVDPRVMGVGPIPAARKALGRAGLDAGDLDVVELNEAFASQSVAVIRELGLDPERVNVSGGAIAIGHPLGMSGARLVVTLLHELRRRAGRYGVATMCVGVGQGQAALFERA